MQKPRGNDQNIIGVENISPITGVHGITVLYTGYDLDRAVMMRIVTLHLTVVPYADMRAGYIVNVFQGSDQGTSDKTAHRLAVLFGNIFLTIMIFMHLSIVIHSVPPINIRYIMRELC